VKISTGNTKLGNIPNISLIPIKDCANCEHCMADCYALKAWKQYPGTRKAWTENSKAFRSDPIRAIHEVDEWLLSKRKPVEYFRIHASGDFLSQQIVDLWTGICEVNPSTKFLAFTKRHDLDFSRAPRNMQIIFSQWPGMPDNAPLTARRAWLQDGTETRIPKSAFACNGSCVDCKVCFDSKKQNVVFDIH